MCLNVTNQVLSTKYFDFNLSHLERHNKFQMMHVYDNRKKTVDSLYQTVAECSWNWNDVCWSYFFFFHVVHAVAINKLVVFTRLFKEIEKCKSFQRRLFLWYLRMALLKTLYLLDKPSDYKSMSPEPLYSSWEMEKSIH